MFRGTNIIFQFRGPMGVRIEVDQSLIFLAGLLMYLSLGSSLIHAMIFVVVLIGSIFLHEVGHAWGCLVQNVPVRRVAMHGGGGFCEHARSATRGEDELIVAMGPLVNLALWAVAGLAEWLLWTIAPGPSATLYYLSSFLWAAAWVNMALFLFNLIPVQPLDGGKLFHLLMLRMFSQPVAHRLTGGVGLVMSIAWIPAMVFLYVSAGWILFFMPSIAAHYRMMRGELAH